MIFGCSNSIKMPKTKKMYLGDKLKNALKKLWCRTAEAEFFFGHSGWRQ